MTLVDFSYPVSALLMILFLQNTLELFGFLFFQF